MQVDVAKKTRGAKTLQLMSFTCQVQFHYQKKQKNIVDELYAYFLKLAPSLFFQSVSSTSHVSLRITYVEKNEEIHRKNSSWRLFL